MAKGLKDEARAEPKAGEFFHFVAGHGACGVLRAHGGHERFTRGAGAYAGETAGFTDHFLGEGIAFAGVCGRAGPNEYL